jgi:hypothetical protein
LTLILTLLQKNNKMIRSEKKLRDLQSILKSNNNIVISEAIGFLREALPFEGAIGLLTKLYDQTEEAAIKKSIEGFMNDIKDQEVSTEVIDELKKDWKVETLNMLISSCWQSGLDYSGYTPEFARAFLKGNYITAFECLTVIEESLPDLSRKKKDEILSVFEKDPIPASNEKNILIQELIAILKK